MAVKIGSSGCGAVAAGKTGLTGNSQSGGIGEYTKDCVEISGREYTDNKNEFNYDSLFKRLDGEIALAKQSCREHAEKQLEEKIDKELQQRRQRPRMEAKKALMKETGVLWTGGLTVQSQQFLMQKSPGFFAEYAEKQKEELEYNLKSK